jgi:hypothetical protein
LYLLLYRKVCHFLYRIHTLKHTACGEKCQEKEKV